MVEFRVLGPVEAIVDGRAVPLPSKPRALLALLLLNRGRVVSVDELVSELWDGDPPETAMSALQVYVSQLRKALGGDRLVTRAPGYAVRLEDGELDLDRFERLVQEARERLGEGDAKGASARLEDALSLWRGPPVAAWLEESRLAALEDRIDADLSLGRHDRLVSELDELIARHPHRERLRGQLMLALYRSGRQAEALDLYRRTRQTLMEELGIEPSPALHDLERAVLRQDPSLDVRRGRPALGGMAAVSPHRARALAAVGVGLLVLAAAAVALIVSDRGGSSPNRDAELRAFVVKIENFLGQSADGRRAIAATIQGAFDCRLAPRAAAARLDRVQRNRQSLLQQVAALSIPDDEGALLSSDLLQKAGQASIAADWHYRDWLLGHDRCIRPDASAELRAARAADARATETKQAFVRVFDPLARRYGERTWTASDF